MAMGRKIDTDGLPSVEEAVDSRDYDGARRAIALKLARLLDGTSSARDGRAIAATLCDVLDVCEGHADDVPAKVAGLDRMRAKFRTVA